MASLTPKHDKKPSVSFILPKPFRPAGTITKTAQLLRRRNAPDFDIGDLVILNPRRIERGVWITEADYEEDIVMVYPKAEIGDFNDIFADGGENFVAADLRKMTQDQMANVILTMPFDKLVKLIHIDNVHKAYPKYQ
ncbi:hypothetical protein FSARC_8121 [Fusarium sarcochroum]|uniref:Uncharacterized protein n=1 Tax=Fusarium sarcochroum TaxID=1208366 RepID=A0A8H4TTS4_9HYPO|nr:hypothetical protein FSARC_8121 [Fusarium sarcochroum]